MKTSNLEVTYVVGFKATATERSKRLVKDVYYAMKRNNQFYKFQRSFLPMKGLDEGEERYITDVNYARIGEHIDFKGLRYTPRKSKEDKTSDVPKIFHALRMISHMLHPKNYDFDYYYGFECPSNMNKPQVLGGYLDFYFRDYCKTKKLKPTGLSFEFLFGIIGTMLFTIVLFLALATVISKGVAFIFGIFIAVVTFIGLIFLVGD
jgi:hypothetical protein